MKMTYRIIPTNKKIQLPKKNYYIKGDSGEDIEIISSFMACAFMGYEKKLGVKIDDMLGDYFGDNLTAWVKYFQKQNGLDADGGIGPITLAKLREYGLDA